MKIVLPGGTGHVGRLLERAWTAAGHQVTVLTRQPVRPNEVGWNGRGPGRWLETVDGSDLVVNLAGRSVNCRYNQANVQEMWDSRIHSTEAIGRAIAIADRPPKLWLQMSTATIYAHRFDAPNDEDTGLLGGAEPDVPSYWSSSVGLARAWERTQQLADTPYTRKVALRTSMVMSHEPGGAFEALLRLTRLGLGGPVAGGRQYMSWIHGEDFVRALDFLVEHPELTGPVNLAAPAPLPYREFVRELRHAAGVPFGLPATRWMAELGALAARSDTELLLKSRRVTPGRLLAAGFSFTHPHWPGAAAALVRQTRADRVVRAVGQPREPLRSSV
ncbi:NAD-dependent epimerase [Kitasatospora sp. MMS16-BH015]|uniref:TIGR01777 family oxidoreductase n=1 Tax=Kitasatospora sp. MMS16-BH015 TaxID=2018025 RepID=UPI000CA1577D|nr:TIGR01777 family oxidoreductase [Kitasatospora sp. MMS16-BH015]AUG82203.1 NAD-dependent epimerase [Kitasatospora sp. MMS16-BH015]